MSLYSISGLGCNGGCSCSGTNEPFGQLSVISGRKQRQARKQKRKERKTRLYCKGARIKAVALAVPRKAFLTLVRLNFKKFALKLFKSMQNPTTKKQLSAKWCKLGGNFKVLENTVLKAVEKYKRKHPGKKVNGIGEPIAITLISTATPIIIALLQFMKKGSEVETPEQAEPGEEVEQTQTTEQSEGETVEGIGNINPYLLAGVVGVGVYFLTKKGKI